MSGVAHVFDLHALKAFAPDKRVRKMLFKTDQLWSEIACYEPGQSTVMHTHPKEEEAIFVLEGTAHMRIDGEDVVVEAELIAAAATPAPLSGVSWAACWAARFAGDPPTSGFPLIKSPGPPGLFSLRRQRRRLGA